jgi:high-affinity iron transporter
MLSIFLQSASILIREGLEALLVVVALAVYLTKAGARDRLPALYTGGALAIAASILAAWIFERYYGGVHNDVLEGVVILGAAALMLYVSGWLLVRQDPRAWQSYLRQKADHALKQHTILAVGGLAFLAVFREGAETVLFIHALAGTSGGWTAALFGGLAAATGVLVLMYLAIRTLALRLPLRAVFLVTSGFLFIMAVKFVGEAIQEFQEQQLLPYNEIRGGAWLSYLGGNPTIEAIAAQAVVVLGAIVTCAVLYRRGRLTPRVAAAE